MKIIKFKNLNTKSNKGFTLIETLVAILILSIAFNAVITLISNSIFSAQYARNQITAMYLAQEAVDHIRNDRDSHAFEKKDLSDWTNFLDHYGSATNDKCFSRNGGCEFDATDWNWGDPLTVKECNTVLLDGTIGCSQLYYDSEATNGKYYSYSQSSSSGDSFLETSFRREISMTPEIDSNSNTYGVDITVKISWMNGNTPRSQVLKTSLLKWQ